jgi:hypothetical protein
MSEEYSLSINTKYPSSESTVQRTQAQVFTPEPAGQEKAMETLII